MWQDATGRVRKALNAEGRDPGHMALGVVATVGLGLLASAVATRIVPPSRGRAVTERPRGPFGLILPAVLSATTFSALRVWNAPPSSDRGAALRLWGVAQVANALLLALRPRSMAGQMSAAMTSAGLAAAFAHRARRIDETSGKLAAPIGGGVRVGNRIDAAVEDRPTVH